MDERDKRRVGEQVEPGNRRKAPGRLELLQRFVNTYNHDLPAGWDRLSSPDKARAWLREKGLLAAGERVSEADAVRLRELREAIRALVVANQGAPPDPGPIETIRNAPAGLVITLDAAGRTSLEPVRRDVGGAVAALLGILHEAQLTGQWPRLKGCRRCGCAFFDRSKNRSAAWCAMSICGNRTKNRAYYRRRRESAR
jgi:predicted RNA-binding Zn ribbon-like protein